MPQSTYRDYFKAKVLMIGTTLRPKFLYRDYFMAKVYTIWAHGPLGIVGFMKSPVLLPGEKVHVGAAVPMAVVRWAGVLRNSIFCRDL